MKPLGVLLTDTHLTSDNTVLVELIFEQCFQLAIELDCEYIFHGGDWFTSRSSQNLETLICLKRILNRARKLNLQIIGIQGNHDRTAQDDVRGYLDIFEKYESLTIISNENLLNFEEHDLSISFLPFFTTSYSDRLDKLTKKVKANGATTNLLITHIAINGVKNNDGTKVSDGIEQNGFNIFDTVLVGHYHNASKLGNNIIYVGSAYQDNFGEDEEKGFTVINSDGSIDSYKSSFPKYIKINIDLDNSNKEDIQRLHDKYQNSRHNIRFIFQGSEEQLEQIDKKTYTSVGIDVKKESKVLIKSIESAEQNISVSFNKASILKNYFEFCKSNEIDNRRRNLGLKYVKGI